MKRARGWATEPAARSAQEPAPLRLALLAQLGGGFGALLFVAGLGMLSTVDLWRIPFLIALMQGGIAALLALKLGSRRWWIPIHLAFVPLIVIVRGLEIAPAWFLGGFVLLLLIFWRTDRSRVPLYLSNAATAEAVLKLLPAAPCRVIDLGCGDGGLLLRLAAARPDCTFVGIEHAPLPWLLARLRALGRQNLNVRYGDFWATELAEYAVVYSFLSPAPMPRLWLKASAEMTPEALLVSNSFEIPGVAADATVAVADRRNTHLFVYRPGRNG